MARLCWKSPTIKRWPLQQIKADSLDKHEAIHQWWHVHLQALQYKTDQIADVKKIEKLNLLFFTLMAQGSEAEGEQLPALCFVYR